METKESEKEDIGNKFSLEMDLIKKGESLLKQPTLVQNLLDVIRKT